uniref:Integrase core domain containing protein n=1 Tax=Solanum tuberosum TaxID=4113 RepID=M1DML9_SOLTU
MSENVGDGCHTSDPVNIDLHRDDIDDVNSVYDPAPLGWSHPRGEGPRRYFQECTEYNDHEEYQTQFSDNPTSWGSDSIPRVNDLLTQILEKVEGSDDLPKAMRDDFYSLNSKVNSHANAIKMPKENEEGEMAVITRSGKVAIGNEREEREENQGWEEAEITDHKNLGKKAQ